MRRLALLAVFAILPAFSYANEPKKPGPFPAEVVGKVTDYKDGNVTLNIGIDAGLEVGMTTDLYRTDVNDPRLLGTIVIERVLPKESVATFIPSGNRKLRVLKSDELPKNFDAAGPHKGKK